MELLLAVILLGAACAVVYGFAHAWRVLVDDNLGDVPWSDPQAERAAKDTARYLGAPYEFARRVEGLTTKEQVRAADAVIVAEREARVKASRQAHRPVKFPRRAS